jgi:hypothetical protein
MKIIFAFLFVGVLTLQVNSQNSPDALVGTKQMNVAEANKLNGIAQPTINGKPYSQYKAEQDALKKEREAKLIAARNNNADAANTITITNTASKTNVVPASKETNKVPDDENPVVPAKQQAQQPVTKQEVKPAEVKQPQVPVQFKLPVAQNWPATAVPDKSTTTATTTQQGNTQVPSIKAATTTTPAQKQD